MGWNIVNREKASKAFGLRIARMSIVDDDDFWIIRNEFVFEETNIDSPSINSIYKWQSKIIK